MKALKRPAWFITGTDTEVGKTFATCALLHRIHADRIQAVGMKPVAAGTDSEGKNDDVESLIAASGVKAPRELINPYLFRPAIAPHIAAAIEGREIDPEHIVSSFKALQELANTVLVEGAGGFYVPLGAQYDTADLAAQLCIPIILVVGMRLGCINHALLTAEAVRARGLPLAGWVANTVDAAMPYVADNLAALEAGLSAPLLGHVPRLSDPHPAAIAAHLPKALALLLAQQAA